MKYQKTASLKDQPMSEEERGEKIQELKDFYGKDSLVAAIIVYGSGRFPSGMSKQHSVIYQSIEKYKENHGIHEIGNDLDNLLFDTNGHIPYSRDLETVIFFLTMCEIVKPDSLFKKTFEVDTEGIREHIFPKISAQDLEIVEEIGGYSKDQMIEL